MQERRLRDAAYTGSDEFSWSYIWMALTDIMVWVAALSLFCAGIPLFGFGLFLPTIIRGLGYVWISLIDAYQHIQFHKLTVN